jgi:Fic family protein
LSSIIERKKGNHVYYYLNHNAGGRQKEIYLGKEIPKNIERIKKEFVMEFYREEWIPELEKIHQRYVQNKRKTPKSVIQEELKNFAIEFTYHTQKIEGSTLTRTDTRRLLEDGITPANKPKSDMVEAELAQQVFFEMLRHEKPMSLNMIRDWHVKLFNKTKIDIAGDIRDYDGISVTNSKAKFPLGDDVFDLVVDFFKWYHLAKSKVNPAELAALVHLKFVSIHPFGDGNGRISRLMMNNVLDENNYPMLNIEYRQREQYYKALEKSQLENDDLPFLRWFMNTYISRFSK